MLQPHDALTSADLFHGLPKETIDRIVQAGSTHVTPPGQHVVDEGRADAGMQIVLDGTGDVTVHGIPRPPLRPGDYFGEVSLIDGGPRSATVVAGPEGLTTFRLSALTFAPLLEDPEVLRRLLNMMCVRVRALEAPVSA